MVSADTAGKIADLAMRVLTTPERIAGVVLLILAIFMLFDPFGLGWTLSASFTLLLAAFGVILLVASVLDEAMGDDSDTDPV